MIRTHRWSPSHRITCMPLVQHNALSLFVRARSLSLLHKYKLFWGALSKALVKPSRNARWLAQGSEQAISRWLVLFSPGVIK